MEKKLTLKSYTRLQIVCVLSVAHPNHPDFISRLYSFVDHKSIKHKNILKDIKALAWDVFNQDQRSCIPKNELINLLWNN